LYERYGYIPEKPEAWMCIRPEIAETSKYGVIILGI